MTIISYKDNITTDVTILLWLYQEFRWNNSIMMIVWLQMQQFCNKVSLIILEWDGEFFNMQI